MWHIYEAMCELLFNGAHLELLKTRIVLARRSSCVDLWTVPKKSCFWRYTST